MRSQPNTLFAHALLVPKQRIRPLYASAAGCLLLYVALGVGCRPAAPDDPTWAADVAPVLAANCVRCHTVPAIGGAPGSFRLDTYNDWVADDGRVVRGAAFMARYMTLRVGNEDNPMPPRAEVLPFHIDVIQNWAANTVDGLPVHGGPKPGNRRPTMEILNTQEQDGWLILDYEILDENHDIVVGALYANRVPVTSELHSGRGQVRWDTGALANGSYDLSAVLDDGSRETSIDLVTYEVDNANRAPVVTLLSPQRDAILASAAAATHDVIVDIADPDSAALTMTVRAYLADQSVDVAVNQAAVVGQNTVTWDISGLDEGLAWRLEVSVDDGVNQRTVQSGLFIVSHQTTQDTFQTILDDVLGARCTFCHPGAALPGLTHDFGAYSAVGDVLGVSELAGLIYRRAVQQRNMPPVSFGGALDDQTAERLGNWLLAGAPQ